MTAEVVVKTAASLASAELGVDCSSFSLARICKLLSENNPVVFGIDDANGDGRKRNLCLAVLADSQPDQWTSYGLSWLAKHGDKSSEPWHKEWMVILERGDVAEITTILCSGDQESTRKRISCPLWGLLSQERILKIKRQGVYFEV